VSYASAVLADSPVLYWRFTEPSGTAVDDSGPNNLDGTCVGGFTRNATSLITTDLADPAITLNGSTGYVEKTDDPLLDLIAPFTLECWVKPSTIGSANVAISKASSFNFGLNAGKLWLSIIGKTDLISTGATLVAGTAYYVAVRWDAAFDAHFYINGAFDSTRTFTSDVNTSAAAFYAGREAGASFRFAGDLDEVAIYSADIGATRILAHYTAATVIPSVENLAPVIYGRGAA
jgi:hypothetical protein